LPQRLSITRQGIRTLSITTPSKTIKCETYHKQVKFYTTSDTQNNSTQHNDTQQESKNATFSINGTQHSDSQHNNKKVTLTINDIQHKGTQCTVPQLGP